VPGWHIGKDLIRDLTKYCISVGANTLIHCQLKSWEIHGAHNPDRINLLLLGFSELIMGPTDQKVNEAIQ
jgi:hypothetical protein